MTSALSRIRNGVPRRAHARVLPGYVFFPQFIIDNQRCYY